MTDARALRPTLAWAALLLVSGCAPLPATQGGVAPPAAPAARAPAAAQPRPEPPRATTPFAAARDSTPSAEAERVLATIPEPLTPSQRVPPPERPPGATTMRAPAAAFDTLRAGGTITMRAPESAYDTLRVERPATGDTAAIPVPSRTQPLGNDTGSTLRMPDTLTAPPVATPPPPVVTPPPASTTPPGTEPAANASPAKPPETPTTPPECWRLQVAAPVEKAKAESRREAAQSLLLVPMVIELEKGLYKVRTHDCMTNEAAEALKKRATDSGFTGAFVLKVAPAAAKSKPKPHTTHVRRPVKKKKRRP